MSAPYILFPPPVKSQAVNPVFTMSEPWIRWMNSIVELFKAVVLHNPKSVSAAYSASPGDTVIADTTAAGFTVTIPLSSKSSKPIHVIKKSADGNTLTIAASGSDKINGAASVTTAVQFGKFSLFPDQVSNWYEF